MSALAQWLVAQHAHAVRGLQMSISATSVTKSRPGFGQKITAARGSIVASPVLGAYDPEPDYFFHWYRDSAIVLDALRLLYAEGALAAPALESFRDCVEFSLALARLDGRELVSAAGWRSRVAPDCTRFVRPDEELARVHGAAVAGETRVNPDGSIDISRWARPQHDGPALRLLAVLRWLGQPQIDAATRERAAMLVQSDLAYVRAHRREPCFDIWEEEEGLHYYTLRVSAAALERAGEWCEEVGETSLARSCRADSRSILSELDGYWRSDRGYLRSRVLTSGAASAKELDIAVVLAAIHARGSSADHSPRDPRQQATLQRLEELFAASYPINHGRPSTRGPALGRYAGDTYYCGGAYYFSTLGAAEFCFEAASGAADAATQWLRRGDAYLETVRAYTPSSGALSEQFDQKSGAQSSARHLAWSYAAFISAVSSRRRALAQLSERL